MQYCWDQEKEWKINGKEKQGLKRGLYIKWPYLEKYFRYCHKIFTQAFVIYYNTKNAKNTKSDLWSQNMVIMEDYPKC